PVPEAAWAPYTPQIPRSCRMAHSRDSREQFPESIFSATSDIIRAAVEHNTAFVFPGQGSQYAGMGRDVAEKYPAARRVFEDIDRALGFSISKVCFEAPEDQLKLTDNTQPAILA